MKRNCRARRCNHAFVADSFEKRDDFWIAMKRTTLQVRKKLGISHRSRVDVPTPVAMSTSDRPSQPVRSRAATPEISADSHVLDVPDSDLVWQIDCRDSPRRVANERHRSTSNGPNVSGKGGTDVVSTSSREDSCGKAGVNADPPGRSQLVFGERGFQFPGRSGSSCLFVMVGSRPSTSVRYSCGLIPRRRQLISIE